MARPRLTESYGRSGDGEDVNEAPTKSAPRRVNHAEYLNSAVGGVATRPLSACAPEA